MIFPSVPYPVKPLSEAERSISYARYYDIPFSQVMPHYRQLMECNSVTPEHAITADHLLDLLKEEQGNHTTGFCRMPDGSAYNTHYAYLPNLTMEMVQWWYKWIPVKTKGAPEGCGNLKYKIWCPPDHLDYSFQKDEKGQMCILLKESMDMGAGDPPGTTYRYRISPESLGLSREEEERLALRGCAYTYSNAKNESKDAYRLNANFTRPHPNGGVEMRQINWFGYWFEDGKAVRIADSGIPSDDMLMKYLIHNTQEIERLSVILPPLYQEYHEKPMDED